MSISFSGFKSTNLIGKNDTVIRNSVVKVPQGREVIFEYIKESDQIAHPVTSISTEVKNSLKRISDNVSKVVITPLDSPNSKYREDLGAVLPSPGIDEIAI